MAEPARNGLLLDTHVWIWVMENASETTPSVRAAVTRAARTHGVYISAISVWEIGMLEAKGRLRLSMEVGTWVERALRAPGFHLVPLTPEIAIESTRLGGAPPGDPADRIIVATARKTGARLVTRDREILQYGKRASGLDVVDAGG